MAKDHHFDFREIVLEHYSFCHFLNPRLRNHNMDSLSMKSPSQYTLLHAKVSLLIVSILLYSCIFTSYSFNNMKMSLRFTETVESNDEILSFVKQSEQGDWRSVGYPNVEFKIYSAYSFDEQQVVIIGSTLPFQHGDFQEVHCLFYHSEDTGKKGVKVRGEIERMAGWETRYAATFTKCSIPLETSAKVGMFHQRPTFVSVLLGNQSWSETPVPIIYRSLKTPPFKFSVCVLPLYWYNEVFHFLEWLEFYRMMGVEHFTFYNRSIGPATTCIMKHYQNSVDGVPIKVKPWHGYPQKNDNDISGGVGLSAGTNECWYSHKGLSKYLIFVDVDEFIVPNEGFPDYHSLFNYLENSSRGQKIGEFSFRNGFYVKSRYKDPLLRNRCGNLKDDFAQFTTCQNLWTMQFVVREDPLNQWDSRSKYIGRPEVVKNGGNHFVHEFETDLWKRRGVDERVAYSRHYRQYKEGPSTKVDRIPVKLGTSLANNVAKKVEYFMKICGFSDTDVFLARTK